MNLKFTCVFDFSSINFLDLNITSIDNCIQTRTYFKPLQANNYVMVNSHHNPQGLKNIPKGQFVRLRRNCSNDVVFASQANDLKEKFVERRILKKNLWLLYLRSNRLKEPVSSSIMEINRI
ncbi:hypothetical protein FKM82_024350 [Ascaphus truei]